MSNLGVLSENGQGVTRDYAEARWWFEKSAALGDALAMRHLGDPHRDCKGVPRSVADARSWYEKAAATGDAEAKERLKTRRSRHGEAVEPFYIPDLVSNRDVRIGSRAALATTLAVRPVYPR